MSLPTAAAPTEVRIAHCLLDADGAVLSAARAEEPFYAASTIKLHVLLAVLRAAEQGAYEAEQYLRPATVAAAIGFVLRAPEDAVVTSLDLRPRAIG